MCIRDRSNNYQKQPHDNQVIHRESLVRPQEVTKRQSAPIASYENVGNQREKIVHQEPVSANQNSALAVYANPPVFTSGENVTPPNVSHSVVNNGSTITITTTISTDPNGAVRVNTNINEEENQPTSLMTETIPVPNNYDHLTAKGGTIPSKDKSIDDFETVIFPTRNASKQFESFIETKKEVLPKKWNRSKKFR